VKFLKLLFTTPVTDAVPTNDLFQPFCFSAVLAKFKQIQPGLLVNACFNPTGSFFSGFKNDKPTYFLTLVSISLDRFQWFFSVFKNDKPTYFLTLVSISPDHFSAFFSELSFFAPNTLSRAESHLLFCPPNAYVTRLREKLNTLRTYSL